MYRINIILLLLVLVSCKSLVDAPSKGEAPTKIEQEEVTPLPALFKTSSNLEWVVRAAKVANCVWANGKYIEAIKKIDKFDYSSDNGVNVVSKLSSKTCTVRTYRTRNPWSSVIATTYASDKEHLYLNTRMNGTISPVARLVNTLYHECSHLAGYGHGDNSPEGKENSVPYFIGDVAEQFVAECM
jgi:hypothetical protein